MRRILPLASLLLLGSALADPLEGTYDVRRDTFLDGTLKGTLKITAQGKALRFTWDAPYGKFSGLGLRLGNAVAVAVGKPECGVAIYTQKGRTFTGNWTMTGAGVGTETFDWDGLKAARVAVRGSNPDGSTYTGDLLLPVDNGYTMPEWIIGKNETFGSGILRDGTLATAFGDQNCQVALYRLNPATGELSGAFYQPDNVQLMTQPETATRR
ncbi:hypothetical protein [Deinococcus daejeonensis]|uniref:Uncharacterized protein n=1 Tax=Deinococcus daejeonensis TaxID=1007098 RepID=A0ABQ2J095_9DEIO|nr:hypothetical protein [Deinococcus daejeonensis]GGN36439.1 hypothetical protein GCM10010842_17290 [Deinococcus daejeonensis]